jgi:LmbE family N-acetylglucosaminyl deacetylase
VTAVTDPAVWTAALAADPPEELDLGPVRRAVVVAAHPDDETLGMGGTLHRLLHAGVALTLVVATDGEAAYPGLDSGGRGALARTRRAELTAAVVTLGGGPRVEHPGVRVHRLGLPDGELDAHLPELTGAIAPLLAGADAYFAPWQGDPHPDHRAAGLAAARAAEAQPGTSTTYGWGYPVWMWPWMRPDQVREPWSRSRAVPLSDADVVAKRRARACYASQISAPPPGHQPVLSGPMLEHSDRALELFVREPRRTGAPAERFEQLYAEGDPWADGSWYERRKRAVLCASLPRERYERAFEPGCGEGALTVELATRCDRLYAAEPVARAAHRARNRIATWPGVSIGTAALPSGIPDGPLDLAVFSEVLYYLDADTLNTTLEATLRALRPGGDLVVAHWTGWPAEAPRTGAAALEPLLARPGLTLLAEHRDGHFTVHVLRTDPSAGAGWPAGA